MSRTSKRRKASSPRTESITLDKNSMDVCIATSVTPELKLTLKRNAENLDNEKVNIGSNNLESHEANRINNSVSTLALNKSETDVSRNRIIIRLPLIIRHSPSESLTRPEPFPQVSAEHEFSDDTSVGYLGTAPIAQYEPIPDASKPLPLKKTSVSTKPIVSVITPHPTCSIGDAKAGERIYKKFRDSIKKGNHIPLPMSASVSPQKKPLSKCTEAKRLTLKASQELKFKTHQMLEKSWQRDFSGLKPKWKTKEEVPVEVVSPIMGSMTPHDGTHNDFNQGSPDENHPVDYVRSPSPQVLSSPSVPFSPFSPSLDASRLLSPQSPRAIVSHVVDAPLTLGSSTIGVSPAHNVPPVSALYDSSEQARVLFPMAYDFSANPQERGNQHSTGMQAQQPVVPTVGIPRVSGAPIQNLHQLLENLEWQLETDMRNAPWDTPMRDGHDRNRNGGQNRGHGRDNLLGLGPDPDRGFSWGNSKGGYSSGCRQSGMQGYSTGPPLHLRRRITDYSELYTTPSCQPVEPYTGSSTTGNLSHGSSSFDREGYIGQDHGQNEHLHRTQSAYYGSDYCWSSADEGSFHHSHGRRQDAGFKEQGSFGLRNGADEVIDPGTPSNRDSEESRHGLQAQGHKHSSVPDPGPQGDPALWPLPWRQEHVKPSANPFSNGEGGAAIYTANYSAPPNYPGKVFDQIGQQYNQ
ncbi:hypothetical protein BGZ51_002579 [Haplosporangium sp. Z 767]|nr:hypothetical protein BGZ51_002579 [Haplosporangium sp. Z 767]